MLVLFIALRAPGLVFFRANSETPRHSSERLQVDLCWFPSFPRLVYLAPTYYVCVLYSAFREGCLPRKRGVGHFPYRRQIPVHAV